MALSAAQAKKNAAVIARVAARRKVRALRKAGQPVPVALADRAESHVRVATPKNAQDAKVTQRTTEVATKNGASSGSARQQAAKELGIKNRRWMNKAELEEAINLATEKRDDGKKPGRLLELEQLGRDRCRAAWDAWKQKQEDKA